MCSKSGEEAYWKILRSRGDDNRGIRGGYFVMERTVFWVMQLALHCMMLEYLHNHMQHVVDRLIGTHTIDMRVIEDLCFTSAINKNAARPLC
nr:hypothetical protein [Tanacetum cinerariifolium]